MRVKGHTKGSDESEKENEKCHRRNNERKTKEWSSGKTELWKKSKLKEKTNNGGSQKIKTEGMRAEKS